MGADLEQLLAPANLIPAGPFVRLYREGVEPSGSLQKVSVHILVPLFWTYPGAREFSSLSSRSWPLPAKAAVVADMLWRL
jgi:hypothetical protein